MSDLCPVYAPFSAMGCTSAIAFTCIGASYGTAKSGVGVAAMSVLRPDQMMKCVVPLDTTTLPFQPPSSLAHPSSIAHSSSIAHPSSRLGMSPTSPFEIQF
ncbi:hypothetical protein B0H14DRAFT_925026 [Mycena olivaceomarginata]|nr:hypothetical protein B0H14DRAFT_925026 [Mycena olivaceomarginata]